MKAFLNQHRWLILIILVAFIVRLYHITNPVADWHSWRQADTASVTREYVKRGIDLLHPRFHDLSNIPSGKNNLDGYRMVEFPFINAFVAWLVLTFKVPLDETSRMVNILMSLGTLISIYAIVKLLSDKRTALLSAAVFALLPYSIYYSRVILPEPGMLFFSTLSLATFAYWLETKKLSLYLVSFLSLSLALLLKPFVLFLAPVYAVLALTKLKQKVFTQPLLYVFPLSFIPVLWWRDWIKSYPEGIPASDWLFNSNKIRLRPAWFRWLGWERVTKMFLGIVGVTLLPLNFFNRKADILVYGAWWVGVIAYMIVIATGNVQHDYYQNLLLPIVCISIARGALVLFDWLNKRTSQHVSVTIVGIVLALSWHLAWQQVKGFFSVNHWEYVEAGQAVDELTPPNSLVIAPAFGDTQFLYQTNRSGWPIGTLIEEKISLGATHYVSTAMDDETNQLKARFATIKQTEKYIILDLTQPIATDSGTRP